MHDQMIWLCWVFTYQIVNLMVVLPQSSASMRHVSAGVLMVMEKKFKAQELDLGSQNAPHDQQVM